MFYSPYSHGEMEEEEEDQKEEEEVYFVCDATYISNFNSLLMISCVM